MPHRTAQKATQMYTQAYTQNKKPRAHRRIPQENRQERQEIAMATRKKAKKTQKRKRKLPGLYGGNDDLDEKFLEILCTGDQRMRVYVYEAKDDWPVPPYLFKCYPFDGLEDHIRDEYGAGEYAIIISRGTVMRFSGVVSIGVPLNWQPRRWG